MHALRLSLVLLLVGIAGGPLGARGQSADSLAGAPDSTDRHPSAVVQRVAGGFAEGNARRLLTPSADRVEISLFGVRTFYSSAQALYVLREFFRRHAPRRFLVRDVLETDTNCFVRGQYEQDRSAQRLQVYVRMGQVEGQDLWVLHEIRIEGLSN